MFRKLSSVFNIKDLLDTTKLNEGDLKNITREGLQVVKSEWENIYSKSVEILTPGLSPRLTTAAVSSDGRIPRLDLSATTELATRYEHEWNSIQTEDERNFRNAKMADELIQKIFETCKEHYESCELIKSEAGHLPKVKEMIEEATISAISLKGKLTELEKMIDEFAKSNEVWSFEKWKQTQIIVFDQYKDEKNKELEEKKKLYDQHYEEFMFNNKAQKVQLYQANFEMQMENYRKRAMDPSLNNDERTINSSDDDIISKLEQVEIETAGDREALEDFLGSSSDVEENVKK